MHTALVIVVFAGMVLAPCVVATYSRVSSVSEEPEPQPVAVPEDAPIARPGRRQA